MPELPEVETIVQQLLDNIKGAIIVDVKVVYEELLDGISVKDFCNALVGRRICDITRRGKYIRFKLSDGEFLVHLRMTGKFLIRGDAKPLNHEHIILELDSGKFLFFEDTRRFAKWYFSERIEEQLAKLGVEPFSKEFTVAFLKKSLEEHKSQIKPFLLSQKAVVGLGNIYADEALWEAKIHPKAITSEVSEVNVNALHKAIRSVLLKGIENKGTSLGKNRGNFKGLYGTLGSNREFLMVYGKTGKPCPRCSAKIKRITVGQRSSHFCPTCQK